MRVALKYGELPHARLRARPARGCRQPRPSWTSSTIFPLAPGDAWSGDGEREWADYSEDEQNSHRALAQTLGNLDPARGAAGRAGARRVVPGEARRRLRRRARSPSTSELADIAAWGTAAIAERTARLTRRLPADLGATRRPSASTTTGSPRSSTRSAGAAGRAAGSASSSTSSTAASTGRCTTSSPCSTASSSGSGRTAREHVVAFSARRGGPIFEAQAWNGQWDALDETNFLYMGWDSKYMLTAVQGVLEEAGLASEVFVKYSYIGAAM